MKKKNRFQCFVYACGWMIGNTILGLMPLIFLKFSAGLVTNKENLKILLQESDKLLQSGIIFFVSSALMGSTIMDILLNPKLQFHRVAFFAINASPIILMIFTCFFYLLSILEIIDTNFFVKYTKFYIFVIGFTILYCLYGRFLIYQKEY